MDFVTHDFSINRQIVNIDTHEYASLASLSRGVLDILTVMLALKSKYAGIDTRVHRNRYADGTTVS